MVGVGVPIRSSKSCLGVGVPIRILNSSFGDPSFMTVINEVVLIVFFENGGFFLFGDMTIA